MFCESIDRIKRGYGLFFVLIDEIRRDRRCALAIEFEDIDHGLYLFVGHLVGLAIRAAGSCSQVALGGLLKIDSGGHCILDRRTEGHDSAAGREYGTCVAGVVDDIDAHITGTRIGVRRDRYVAAAGIGHAGVADAEFLHAGDQR